MNKNSIYFPKEGFPPNWKIVKLKEIGTFTKGSGITKSDLIDDGVPCIRYGEIYTTHDFIIKKFYSFINSKIAQSSKRIFAGDILFAGSGETAEEIGKCVAYIGSDEAYAGGDIVILRVEQGDPKFLGFLLNHDIANQQKSKLGQGHSVVHIYSSHLENIIIPFPSLPEQRKIAEILSTWDEAIAKTEQLIAALRQRKKGLMQRLLNGQVRFPGFEKSKEKKTTKYGEIPVDWNYVSISEIAHQISLKNSKKNNLPVLSCTKYDGLVDSLKYFGRQIYSDDTSTYKIVKRNQFAFATNHIEEGSIGYQNVYDQALISPMYTVFETNVKIDDGYLYKLLKTELYRHIFEVNTSASVARRGSLRWNVFEQIKIPLPSLEEQRVISKVLDACTQEIDQTKTYLEALNKQKKGLMQQLLTGKVRVKFL